MARFEAAGKKLSPEEKAKRDEHPFDAYARFKAESAKGQFPKGLDNFRWRFHGLFYVAPTQNSYMCRLRIANGILSHWQLAGVADLARGARRRLRARDDARQSADPRCDAGGRHPPARGAGGPRHHHQRDGCRQHPQRHRLAHGRHRPAGAARHPSLRSRLAPPHPQRPLALRPAAQVQRRLRRRRRHPRAGGHQRHRLHGRDGGARARASSRACGSGSASAASPATRISRKYGGVYVKPEEAVAVADAIVRVFIANGDRTDRKKARLKYVLDAWGLDKFLAEVEAKLGAKLVRLATDQVSAPNRQDRSAHIGFHAQKQAGKVWAGVALPVGKLTVRADARPRPHRPRAGRRRYPPHRLAEPADLRHRRGERGAGRDVPAARSASPPRPPACAPG